MKADSLDSGSAPISITKNPLFWVVALIKLGCSFYFGSEFVRSLFLPFITYFVDSGFANPWNHFTSIGQTHAFPYSSVMLFLLSLPQWIVTQVTPMGWIGAHESIPLFLIRIPMFFADLSIFWVLCQWFSSKKDKVLHLYWFSPILFFITYIHGQIDSIPTAFLFLTLFFVFQDRLILAGVLFGLGIATKFHLLLAAAFLFFYFWSRYPFKSRIEKLTQFFGPSLLTAAAFILPFLGSEGYRTMVFGTRETSRLFELAFSIGNEVKVYAAPFVIMVILLRFATNKRVGRDSLVLFLALSYSALVLLVPPMPGWYYWSIPFVCYFYIRQESINEISYWIVNLLYFGYYGFFWQKSHPVDSVMVGLASFFFTCLQSALATVMFWIYRIGIRSNHDYNPERTPTLIGISGDSGAGKDTLARALRSLLGDRRSVQTNGDDYHRWERGESVWSELTHLNPKANFMFLPVEHATALKAGQPIQKPIYDHDTGKFTDPLIFKPKPYVFFVGLHTFYIRKMRGLLDLKIYLEPEESLRTEWKIQRDRTERGYSSEKVIQQMALRKADSDQFIKPQKQFADWIISYYKKDKEKLSVAHIVRNDLPVEELVNALNAVKTLRVQWSMDSDFESQRIEVTGEMTVEDTQRIAILILGPLFELIGTNSSQWSSGYDGISQLLFLLFLRDIKKIP